MKQNSFRRGMVAWLFLWLLLSATIVSGADISIQAGLTCYPDPELGTVVLVEFPFTLNRDEFEFYLPDSDDSSYYARIYAEIKIMDSAGFEIDSAKTYFSAMAQSLSDAATSGLKLFDKLSVVLEPGLYTARLTVIDVVSKNEGVAFYDSVLVERSPTDRLDIGGASLAYNILWVDQDANVNQRLVQNGLLVYPNPLGVYSISDSLLYLYAELYNVPIGVDNVEPIKIQYHIENAFGRVVRDFGYKPQPRAGHSMVLVESLDIAQLPVGAYEVKITASDSSHEMSTVERLKFMVLSPAAFTLEAQTGRRLTDPYDTLDLEHRLQITQHFLSPAQKSTLSSLTEEGKQNYLDQFWREYSDRPDLAPGESRRDIIARYNYANLYFSTGIPRTDGWATDRGRIYMIYGEPDRIVEKLLPTLGSPDDASSLSTANPYIVWFYDQLEKGIQVVFEDTQNMDDYTLVHSNLESEIYSKYWEQALKSVLLEVDN